MIWANVWRFSISCILMLIIGNGSSLLSADNRQIEDGQSWSWHCIDNRCLRRPATNGSSILQSSPETCRLICGRYGALWPRPAGSTTLSERVLKFHPNFVRFDTESTPFKVKSFLERMTEIFKENVKKECGDNCTVVSDTRVAVILTVTSEDLSIDWSTDEEYTLDLSTTGKNVTARINAETVFGARHGLETLSQLVTSYKTPSRINAAPKYGLIILTGARIRDKPIYPHRGLMLDTARNFIPLPAILRTIDSMASSKLNVFHWHITDTQSFPMESLRVPQLVRFGAYSPEEVYSVENVHHVIKFAKQRGIRVLLEVDAPAHAGAGWQWGPAAGLGNLVVCWQHQPWREQCIQPPCGQLNPANPRLYRVLGDLFKDIAEFLPPGEFFHMGGDELFFPCWNATKEITDLLHSRGMGRERADFIRLWAEYQATALRIYDEAAGSVTSPREPPGSSTAPAPIILWSSHLTSPSIIEKYLQKDRYVIQTWVVRDDLLPSQLLELGYKVIFSTKDTWYLDHGFWGNTQYHSWRVAYDNTLPRSKLVLGGEVCMWTEYVDESNLDGRIWPRAAAVAERLWSDPNSSSKFAQGRLARHRERLLKRGVNPEELQPLWCYQNEGECA